MWYIFLLSQRLTCASFKSGHNVQKVMKIQTNETKFSRSDGIHVSTSANVTTPPSVSVTGENCGIYQCGWLLALMITSNFAACQTE